VFRRSEGARHCSPPAIRFLTMPANQPRKHHFLPQFYLRRFAGPDGATSQLFRKSLKIVRTSVGDAAARRDYHRFEVSKPTFGEFEMEHMMSQVEGHQAEVVRAILDNPGDYERHRVELLGLTQFMFFRVPKMRESVAGSTQATLIASIKVMEKAKAFDDMPSDLKAHLAGRSILDVARPEIKNWYVMLQLLRLATDKKIYRLLYGMNISLLVADGFGSFVVSDAAAVFFDKNYGRLPGNLGGLSSPSAELTLPLSPRVLLRVAAREPAGVFRLSDADVNRYNERAIIWAEQSLFADTFDAVTLAAASRLAGTSAGFSAQNLEASDGIYTISQMKPVHPALLKSFGYRTG
jgi:hypothetical protein